ncbi:flavodoxin domain-containing protein [Lacticaseibacillus nasuensis]|nr:flavodoxin domain-containing protein [Lacticaseibacillus nasuensis]
MKVLILYASITGNAKGMARVLEQFFTHAQAQVTVGEMQQTDAATLTHYDIVVLATYTWTGGTIPEESEDFYLDMGHTDYSQQPLVFGVVGTGDPYYGKDYNTAPALFTATLRASGAIQGAETVKIANGVDEGNMPAFEKFTKQLLSKYQDVHDAAN